MSTYGISVVLIFLFQVSKLVELKYPNDVSTLNFTVHCLAIVDVARTVDKVHNPALPSLNHPCRLYGATFCLSIIANWQMESLYMKLLDHLLAPRSGHYNCD